LPPPGIGRRDVFFHGGRRGRAKLKAEVGELLEQVGLGPALLGEAPLVELCREIDSVRTLLLLPQALVRGEIKLRA
jgi:hypothetical protein